MIETKRLGTSAALLATMLAACVLVLAGTPRAEASLPGLASNNGYIVFASDRVTNTSPEGDLEIYATRPSGTETIQLTTNAVDDYGPAVSPEGARIAFVRGGGIYIMNADGTSQKRLSNPGSSAFDSDPAFSPDGARIAFARSQSGDGDIWGMRADGSAKSSLTGDPQFSILNDDDPAYSPDGTMIAFERQGPECGHCPFFDGIWVNSLDGSGNGFTIDGGSDPSWSPDSTRMAFDSGGDVFISNADGTQVNLSNNGDATSEREPSWSPDGAMMAFLSDRDGDDEVYTMKAVPEGTDNQPRRLTTNDTADGEPDWQAFPVCTKEGTPGDDRLSGTTGRDVICGRNGDDVLSGLAGNDIFVGGAGDDTFVGASGNDVLLGGGALQGDMGIDTASFAGAASVQANLTTGFAAGVGASAANVGLDSLVGVENLVGSTAGDVLSGSAAANSLVGSRGDDRMLGLAGNDTLNARDGVSGNDTLNGGPGTDTCLKDATEASIKGCP